MHVGLCYYALQTQVGAACLTLRKLSFKVSRLKPVCSFISQKGSKQSSILGQFQFTSVCSRCPKYDHATTELLPRSMLYMIVHTYTHLIIIPLSTADIQQEQVSTPPRSGATCYDNHESVLLHSMMRQHLLAIRFRWRAFCSFFRLLTRMERWVEPCDPGLKLCQQTGQLLHTRTGSTMC